MPMVSPPLPMISFTFLVGSVIVASGSGSPSESESMSPSVFLAAPAASSLARSSLASITARSAACFPFSTSGSTVVAMKASRGSTSSSDSTWPTPPAALSSSSSIVPVPGRHVEDRSAFALRSSSAASLKAAAVVAALSARSTSGSHTGVNLCAPSWASEADGAGASSAAACWSFHASSLLLFFSAALSSAGGAVASPASRVGSLSLFLLQNLSSLHFSLSPIARPLSLSL
mmetsp:Transcript_35312/g.49027  ORF Transcript_35312/g.49027 Transcript_35312/m.49027 type:complete len:231 (+) Transcript_35312:331-1023(+)